MKSRIFKAIEPAPAACHKDLITTNPLYANDQKGDCVIAARAHMTRRFENFEQGLCLEGTDSEVLLEYYKEGGATPCHPHPDNGLVELDSLNAWRKNGWKFGGQNLNIYAHGNIDWTNEQLLMDCLYYLNGAFAGIRVSARAEQEFQTGQLWDAADNDGGIVGGHAIYLPCDYDSTGIGLYTCITWGKKQFMTRAFMLKYFDECHGVVDSRDSFLGDKSPVDVELLDSILKEITGG